MKRVWLIFAIVITCVFVLSLIWFRRRDASPQIHLRPTFDSLVNVHGSAKKILSVCGRSFSNVRGAPPYFESVSNSTFLIFVYSPAEEERILVAVDTNICSFYQTSAKNTRFGDKIGYWTATTGSVGDTAVMSSPLVIQLQSIGFSYNQQAVWTLTNNSVTEIKLKRQREKTLFELP